MVWYFAYSGIGQGEVLTNQYGHWIFADSLAHPLTDGRTWIESGWNSELSIPFQRNLV